MFMMSSGGLTAASLFQGKDAVLSGPAGGVAGAIYFCSRAGFDDILTFDMGGTSTDVALIQDSKARVRRETFVGDVKVRAPSVDVRTVGAGGGFLVVPALVLLGGMSMAAAVGTSLLVIAMNSTAGLAGHLASVSIDWPFAAAVTGLAVVGSVAGGLLAGRVPQERLRTGFGWFVLVMGVVVLGQSALAT